jgi:hypothetical protein
LRNTVRVARDWARALRRVPSEVVEMRTSFCMVSLAVLLSSTFACRDPRRLDTSSTTETTSARSVGPWQEATRDWPAPSISALHEMVDKYGAPDEVTPSHLVWNARGPWKKSIVSRDPVKHAWPSPHDDVLEQVVAYRVPPDKADDLAAFDGSVMFERTKGELSARCGGEAANFLALNLAKEIIGGTRNVEDARRVYEDEMKAFKAGDKSRAYLSSLMFAPLDNAADPDRPAVR